MPQCLSKMAIRHFATLFSFSWRYESNLCLAEMGRGAAFVMYMPLWQAACTGQDVEEFESLYDEGKKATNAMDICDLACR